MISEYNLNNIVCSGSPYVSVPVTIMHGNKTTIFL